VCYAQTVAYELLPSLLKAGMVHVWVACKTLTHGPYLSALDIKGL